jgi:LacI family transcriptional regulator/LacI family purine nucleotide synthesis repressor
MIERIENPRQEGKMIMLEPNLVVRSSVAAVSAE